MAKLLISPAPSDSHGETNMVFVNPEDPVSTSYIKLNNFVFRVQKDPVVPRGNICLNFIQRKICRYTTHAGDAVDVLSATKGLPTVDVVALVLKIEVEHFSASKKGGVIDYTAFVEFFKQKFDNQFFTEHQAVLVVLDGAKYIATVREAEYVKASDGIAPESPARAAANPASPGPNVFGLVTKATTVCVSTVERCQLQLINIPDKQQDMNQAQVVKDFDLEKLGIGGLKKEFAQIFRRAFASRIFPQSVVKKLGIKHCKGMLLFGVPGCGKTLIARQIAQVLNASSIQVVDGPSVMNKMVGGSEENVRKLFLRAEEEQAAKGDASGLHVIIFDEFDSICKSRGSTGDNTGAADNVVNQLLSKIDGVNCLNNVLLIGMTNRKDRIDDAILRPGRFEIHIEIGLPDEEGRQEILRIHTKGMRETQVLSKDVDMAELAALTKNYTGAELEGVVRAAQSHAFQRHVDFENPTKVERADEIFVNMNDFVQALSDVKPALGQAVDECKSAMKHGIIDYGESFQTVKRRLVEMVKQLKTSKLSTMSLLLHGEVGSGKTALAAFTALESEFPYVKFLSAAPMVGYSELNRCNQIRKAFEDGYKSPLSVVILDDIERLIDLAQGGSRYTNSLLQTILVLTKAKPPEGKKLLVIGTTSLRSTLESLEVTNAFSAEVEVPLVPANSLTLVSRGLGGSWKSRHQEELAEQCLPEGGIPIVKMIMLIELASGPDMDEEEEHKMAAAAAAGGGSEQQHQDHHRTLTFERFSDARLQLGFS